MPAFEAHWGNQELARMLARVTGAEAWTQARFAVKMPLLGEAQCS